MIWNRSGGSYSPASDRRLLRTGLLLAGLLLASFTLGAAEEAGYVLVTRDGHRIDAREKPAVEEGMVRIRLHPSGMLTVLHTDRIDWPATERFNENRAPAPAPPGKRPEPGREAPAAGPGDVKEMKITGSKFGQVREPAPAVEPDAAKGAARLAGLQREFQNLQRNYDSAVQSRDSLRRQIAGLEAKVARDPEPSGVQEYKSPSRKALDEARASLQTVEARVGVLESRMNEVRFQAVMLGGSVD